MTGYKDNKSDRPYKSTNPLYQSAPIHNSTADKTGKTIAVVGKDESGLNCDRAACS